MLAIILFGIVWSLFTIAMSIFLFTKLSKGIDEMIEIKSNNNSAAAIVLAGVIFSTAITMQAALSGIPTSLSLSGFGAIESTDAWWGGFSQALIGFLIAVVSPSLLAFAVHRISVLGGFDVHQQIRNKNVAVAITMAAILVAVSWVNAAWVSSLWSI